MILIIGITLCVLLGLVDPFLYSRAVDKYGSRHNYYPFSGFYELFIKKGKD